MLNHKSCEAFITEKNASSEDKLLSLLGHTGHSSRRYYTGFMKAGKEEGVIESVQTI